MKVTFGLLVFSLVLLGSFVATNVAQETAQRVIPPVTVTVQAIGDVRWILPGPRALDPEIFGTPHAPLGLEPDVGVPLGQRLTNEAGTAYTTTKGPTPMSDNWERVAGDLRLRVRDVTAFDGPSTEDEIDLEAVFTGPDLTVYKVQVDRAIPEGPDHPFFGGVGTNVLMHGKTGIGTKLQPTQFAWVTLWGVGKLFVDGQLVVDDQLVHMMLTQRVRSSDAEGYKLAFDKDLSKLSGMEIHLILPPISVTLGGPKDRPIPTGFVLPNGQEQPFIHMMFDNIATLSGKVEP